MIPLLKLLKLDWKDHATLSFKNEKRVMNTKGKSSELEEFLFRIPIFPVRCNNIIIHFYCDHQFHILLLHNIKFSGYLQLRLYRP